MSRYVLFFPDYKNTGSCHKKSCGFLLYPYIQIFSSVLLTVPVIHLSPGKVLPLGLALQENQMDEYGIIS